MENKNVCIYIYMFFSYMYIHTFFFYQGGLYSCFMTSLFADGFFFFMKSTCLKFYRTIYMSQKNHFRWKLKCHCKTAFHSSRLKINNFPWIYGWGPYLSQKSECVPYWAYCSLLKEILPCGNHFAGFQVDKCLPRGIRMHFYKTALKSNVCQLLR